MYTKGQVLKGYIINDAGEDVLVQGTYEFTTDDPEEMIQDVVLRLPCGKLQYVDEQYIVR